MNVNIFHKQNCTQILILIHFWVCPLRNTMDMTEESQLKKLEVLGNSYLISRFPVRCS